MNKKSIYKYASECGVPVGIYLTIMSMCLLMSVRVPLLASLLFPLAIIFPFYLGYFIKRIGKKESSYMKFSSLWLGGIYTVIFGTLICMFFSALYIVYVEPGFVQAYCLSIIDNISASPVADEYKGQMELLKDAMEARLLPSGLDFVTSMGWFTAFAGSIISLVIAAIVSITSKKITKAIS